MAILGCLAGRWTWRRASAEGLGGKRTLPRASAGRSGVVVSHAFGNPLRQAE